MCRPNPPPRTRPPPDLPTHANGEQLFCQWGNTCQSLSYAKLTDVEIRSNCFLAYPKLHVGKARQGILPPDLCTFKMPRMGRENKITLETETRKKEFGPVLLPTPLPPLSHNC